MREQAFQTSHWQALAALWRQQLLCDVQLRSSAGEVFPAHSIVLASASGFFRALLCGAGRSMREGSLATTSQLPAQSSSDISPAAGNASSTAGGQVVVDLPYSGPQLRVLLDVLYEHTLEVCPHSVSWLLDMAAYLEVQALQDACCDFLRSALSSDAYVDVLLLAHHYHCTELQEEGVTYLAKRLSSLLLLPDARQVLMRLPQPLLQQLLSSEALEVEQESELLCFLADWVSHAPHDRQHSLPQLLPLLKLSALPQEQLSQHQLQACSGPPAAALAQQLYQAAQACQAAQPQQMQQHLQELQRWQQPQQHNRPQQQDQQQQQQLQAARRQAGQPMADAVVSGQRLTGGDPGPLGAPGSAACAGDVAGAGAATLQDDASFCWDSMREVDVNNYSSTCPPGEGAAGTLVCNNHAAVSPISSSGGSSSGCTAALSLCDVRSIGAVVAQAWPGRQRGYQPTTIMVAGGHDPSWRGLRTVEFYNPVEDTWRSGPMLPMALPFAGAGVPTRGQAYVIGGAMCSNYMARLDVANEEWHNCEGPQLSRLHAGVAGAAGLLYITGGRTQVNQVVPAVEAYDHASSTWSHLPDMLQPRYAHAVVAQGGCLYALGGQASKAIHRTVEVFDAQRGSWQDLGAQLISERKYCAAASLGGRLLVLGGMKEARRRLSSVEAYDPREGRWSELTSMQHARSSCSVACVGGRLYVMGGNAGNEQLHGSVEVLDPMSGRWSSSAALSCGRSGLTAVAV